VLTGTFAVSPVLAGIAAIGFVLSSVYSLWLIYRLFQGPERRTEEAPDLAGREMAVFGAIIAAIVWVGVYPQPVLRTSKPTVDSLVSSATYVMQSSDESGERGRSPYEETSTREAKYDGR
jgi:NADH-quinone oxidoreductase subunit M